MDGREIQRREIREAATIDERNILVGRRRVSISRLVDLYRQFYIYCKRGAILLIAREDPRDGTFPTAWAPGSVSELTPINRIFLSNPIIITAVQSKKFIII